MFIAAGTDWGVIGTLVASAVALAGFLWKVWAQVGKWRNIDAQQFGKLAHLFARWMDQTDFHLTSQDNEIYDIKNRLHALERREGLSPLPPRPKPVKRVNRVMEATEAFGPPADFGLDEEETG